MCKLGQNIGDRRLSLQFIRIVYTFFIWMPFLSAFESFDSSRETMQISQGQIIGLENFSVYDVFETLHL